MCIIIRDVHEFIGHCLIPLDPWWLYVYYLHKTNIKFLNYKSWIINLSEAEKIKLMDGPDAYFNWRNHLINLGLANHKSGFWPQVIYVVLCKSILYLLISSICHLKTFTSHVCPYFLVYHGRKGHWIVNHIGTQSFIITLSYLLALELLVLYWIC